MADNKDYQLEAMREGEDPLSDQALLNRLYEVGTEKVTDLLAEGGPLALDRLMRMLTGGTERENLIRGQEHPAYGKLSQLRTANIGSQEGHALASEEMMRRWGLGPAITGGLLAELGEYAVGTSGSEGDLPKDTMLDLGANLAGIIRPKSEAASDWIIDKLVSNYGNPARMTKAPQEAQTAPWESPSYNPRK